MIMKATKGTLLRLIIPSIYRRNIVILHFFPKRIDISKCLIVVCTIFDKKLRRLHEKFKVE